MHEFHSTRLKCNLVKCHCFDSFFLVVCFRWIICGSSLVNQWREISKRRERLNYSNFTNIFFTSLWLFNANRSTITSTLYAILNFFPNWLFSRILFCATSQRELSEATETGQFFSFSLYLSVGLAALALVDCCAAEKEKKTRRQKLSERKMFNNFIFLVGVVSCLVILRWTLSVVQFILNYLWPMSDSELPLLPEIIYNVANIWCESLVRRWNSFKAQNSEELSIFELFPQVLIIAI